MRRFTSIICAAVTLITATPQARAATPITKCGTVIKAPGSYVVTKNLTLKLLGASPGACITIAANYVTLDLGGFSVGCGGDTNAFAVTDGGKNLKGISIRNGFITGSCYVGLAVASSTGVLIDRVSAIANSSTGMSLGSGSLVVHSISNDNAEGISLGCPSNAIDDTALGNGTNLGVSTACNLFNSLAP
jgi:hypothetical protein